MSFYDSFLLSAPTVMAIAEQFSKLEWNFTVLAVFYKTKIKRLSVKKKDLLLLFIRFNSLRVA